MALAVVRVVAHLHLRLLLWSHSLMYLLRMLLGGLALDVAAVVATAGERVKLDYTSLHAFTNSVATTLKYSSL